jgi:hypothetical protein
MREKIRSRQYVVTLHADEEMDADGFSIFDVENCILMGEVIIRQKDINTGEWKYIVSGTSRDSINMNVIGKISSHGKLVIITVYAD